MMKITEEKRRINDPNDEFPWFFELFRQSPIAIKLYDKDGKLRDVNQAYLDLFGISNLEEVKDFNLFTDPTIPKQAISDIREGKIVKYEFEINFELIQTNNLYQTSREGIGYQKCYINPAFNENKEISGYILHATDITERKKAESELMKSEEKFRRIIESLTKGIYFYKLNTSDHLILTGANPAADKMLGLPHQSLIGKTIEEVFPNLVDTEIPLILKKIAKGECGPKQFDIEFKDENITGYYNLHVFQTEKDTITVNFNNITGRKKAELLLEKQAKELQELNVTKDKFLSIIAHDLKNPFNAILGFSDLMLKNYYLLDDETFLKGLRTIESASSHAYKLLENLLIWSQNQTGRSEFNPERLNLKELVTESLSLVENVTLNKEIRVVVSIKKAQPIFADKNMINSILMNLISNAIKFSYKGGKIKITATVVDHEIHISVADNGVGITPEKHSAIFEIDKRSNTIGTDNEQGTGLGLILCKDFVTRHGGKIWIESTPGKGSKFTFSLPII